MTFSAARQRPPARQHNGRLSIVLFTLLLAACTTTPRVPLETPDSWLNHQARLTTLDHWELRGKLGYRGPDANGSAWLSWQQKGQDFDLTLTGPMGAGATRISGNPELAVLSRGRNEIRAHSPSALTQEALGTQLPLEELPWWIRGLPAPGGQESITLDDRHLLAALSQTNWELRFDRYLIAAGYLLPGRITGDGTGPNQGLGFTLVINQWQPQGAVSDGTKGTP